MALQQSAEVKLDTMTPGERLAELARVVRQLAARLHVGANRDEIIRKLEEAVEAALKPDERDVVHGD